MDKYSVKQNGKSKYKHIYKEIKFYNFITKAEIFPEEQFSIEGKNYSVEL